MRHTVKTQLYWDTTTHILRDYLLNTSIPLIFETILKSPDDFDNASWDNFMHPQPSEKNPHPKSYKPTDLHNFVWEYILKNTLIMVFRDRLLGHQTTPELYIQRSERYVTLFNDMIGGQDCSFDLLDIINRFYSMVKDYLCRHLPGKESDYADSSVKELLNVCRQEYRSRRYRDDMEADVERKFYVDFEGQTYSSAMLEQFDEMSEEPSRHPNSRHFIILGEMIVTLFIYVYMVDYIMFYPHCKGDTGKRLTAEQRNARNYNLFAALAGTDYPTLFFHEKKKRDTT